MRHYCSITLLCKQLFLDINIPFLHTDYAGYTNSINCLYGTFCFWGRLFTNYETFTTDRERKIDFNASLQSFIYQKQVIEKNYRKTGAEGWNNF